MDRSDAIPWSELPAGWFVRRWPELAELEDNPFFLLWRYRRINRGPHKKWKFLAVNAGRVACVFGFTPLIALGVEGLCLCVVGYLVLAGAAMLVWGLGRRRLASGDTAHLYGLFSPAMVRELQLTTIDHRGILLGLIAPFLSRRRVARCAFWGVAAVVGFGAYGRWLVGFPWPGVAVQCAAIAVGWIACLQCLDLVCLSHFAGVSAKVVRKGAVLDYSLFFNLLVWPALGLCWAILAFAMHSFGPAVGAVVVCLILGLSAAMLLIKVGSDVKHAQKNIYAWSSNSKRIFAQIASQAGS